MNPQRKKKLSRILFIFCILACACALVLYALRQNISLFYSPSQVVNHEAPLNKPIRLGGMVEKGSLVRGTSLEVAFNITDFNKSVKVSYKGILPDLFREGQGIVAEGVLQGEQFIATRVLAKHDANYMPPEVKAALAKKEAS